MPRLPRLVVPGRPLHVIQRGNDRRPTFQSVRDHMVYLDFLFEVSRATDVSIHAYVLMTNHVHLLVTPESEDAPARLMQSIGRRYVRYFNTRYARTGTLWESRYRSSVIDSEHYLLACARYIERNPVRAGMVGTPAEYSWSSYHHNAYGTPDRLLRAHPVLLALGTTPSERRAAYRALFTQELPEDELTRIRRSTQRGDATGGEAFLRQLAMERRRPVVRRPVGGRVAPCGMGDAGVRENGVRVTEPISR